MKFSIIVPTHNRADGRLQRAIGSVVTQTYQDWECIVVDDGSTDETHKVLPYLPATYDKRLHIVRHGERQGRVVARNTGMAAARGEWICWLDSDDAYDATYLATFAHNIEQEPDARLFVCGVVMHGMVMREKVHVCPAWTKIRPAWMPPVDANGKHTLFSSGKVGTGMFVFHRECYEAVGPMPPWRTCYEVSDGIDEWLGVEPGATGYGSGGPGSHHAKAVGNPWGDDHAYFQALALRYRVHLIHAALYTQYRR